MKRLFAVAALTLLLSGASMAADYDGFANFYSPDANKMDGEMYVPTETGISGLSQGEQFIGALKFFSSDSAKGTEKMTKEVRVLYGTERWIGSALPTS